MIQPKFKFPVRGNFLNGQFQIPQNIQGDWTVRCPGDFADEIGKFQYSYTAIEEGIQSARGAILSWKRTGIGERSNYLLKYQAALKRRAEELSEVIAREVGKPLWEAQIEVASMINKVTITLNESLKWVTEWNIPNIAENTIGVCRYRPLGTVAVIGPFNFPGHLSNGHIVPALLTGNTVIFKPSEKAPLVGQLMAECFQEAGFPPGVFNLIQGEREVGRRLCVHEGVDAVLFTGSYEVGTRIKQDTLQQHWKLLALEMGGKNASIVWHDAQIDGSVYECLMGAFLTAGQRCSATSRIIVHKKILDAFVSRFHERSKAFSIGHPLENPFMGPLIDQGSVDRYMKFLGIASREGCEIVMRGKILELSTQGNYVTPSICLAQDGSLEKTRKSTYQQTELFAPNVVILGVDDLEEAVDQANATQYGLVASVFTQDRIIYEKCLEGLQVGLVNWNHATSGASSRLPFGGLKKSGNHFPTALSAVQYCTHPISSLEVSGVQLPNATDLLNANSRTAKTPGLNWA